MSTSWDNARHSWEEGTKRVKGAWQGFKDFLLRESVLEVAVGLIIASAFTRIVNSMVTDMILPFVSLLPMFNKNLPQQFVTLRRGPHQPNGGYNTIQQAEADGAIYLAYGRFIDSVLNFFAIGLVLYFIARIYAFASGDSIIKHSTKCSYCRKEISEKASRCPFCTSQLLEGRDFINDQETSALAPATQ